MEFLKKIWGGVFALAAMIAVSCSDSAREGRAMLIIDAGELRARSGVARSSVDAQDFTAELFWTSGAESGTVRETLKESFTVDGLPFGRDVEFKMKVYRAGLGGSPEFITKRPATAKIGRDTSVALTLTGYSAEYDWENPFAGKTFRGEDEEDSLTLVCTETEFTMTDEHTEKHSSGETKKILDISSGTYIYSDGILHVVATKTEVYENGVLNTDESGGGYKFDCIFSIKGGVLTLRAKVGDTLRETIENNLDFEGTKTLEDGSKTVVALQDGGEKLRIYKSSENPYFKSDSIEYDWTNNSFTASGRAGKEEGETDYSGMTVAATWDYTKISDTQAQITLRFTSVPADWNAGICAGDEITLESDEMTFELLEVR